MTAGTTLLICCAVLLLARVANCSTMTINALNTTVSTQTDYQFLIENTDSTDIFTGAVIVISFPADYATILTSGSYSCSQTSWFQSVTLSCTLTGLVMTITGGFPVDRPALGQVDEYNFVIYNIINPPYATYTDIFNGEFSSATGVQLMTMQSNGGNGILLTQGTMTCSLTVSPTTVTSKAILTVTVTPAHSVPVDGQLVMSTNTYWLRDTQNSTKIFDSTAQCSGSTGAAGNLGCSLNDDVIDKTMTITVLNLISTSGTSTFSFTVSPFNTPPTTEPQGSFSLQTGSNGGKTIDGCTGVKLTTVTTGQLTSPSFVMANTLINTVAQGNLTFKLATAIFISDTIEIKFPGEMSLSITGIIMASGNRAVQSYSVVGSVLSLVIGTGTQLFLANTVITLLISSVGNPPSTATTGIFSISTKRSNYGIDSLVQSLTYTATSGVLSASLSASVLEIGATSVYTLQVTFTNKVTSAGVLYITFPNVFTMASGTFSCTSNASISTTCNYASSSRTMTVTSISTSGVNSGTTVSLTINGITNPISVGSFQSLSLASTYNSSSDYVDTLSSGLSLTLTTRLLPASNVAISASASTVYTLTTMTITITNQNPLAISSLLYIVIPSQVAYSGSYSCMKGALGVSCSNATIDSQPCILVSLGNAAVIAAGDLASTPITISNIYTPTSTKQTSTFKFYLVYSDGTRSEQLTAGKFFSVSSPSKFATLKVTPSSNTNYYSPTSFGVVVGTNFAMTNNSRLQLTFPTAMTCTATCTAVSSWLQPPTCSNSSNVVTVQLLFTTTGIQSFELSFDNMKNFPSLASYSVKVTMTSSDGAYQISEDTYNLQNTLPNVITLNSWSFNSTILKESSTFSVSMTPTVPLGSTDYILITFPAEFTVASPICTLSSQQSCSNPTSNVLKIVSTGVFPATLAITISGITNPSASSNSPIFIETYNSADKLYDQDYSVKFQRFCTAYCRTCLSTNTSSCLTCYTDGTLVSGNTILSGTTCTSGCGSGSYYNTSTMACATCSTNCTECISYSGCTACPANYYLYNQACVGGCPLGYYTDSVTQTCAVCTAALHCQTCTTSLACASCVNGYLLYGKFCLTNCPTPTFTEDIYNRVCQPCPTNCTQCSGTTFVTCTKCTAGYLLDQGGCYLTCQTPSTVPSSDGLTCTSCSITCLTCSGTQYNCLSCNTSSANKYLSNNNCLSSCGVGYYGDNTLFTCTRCTPSCDTCVNASITSCLSCLSGNYLYGTTCTTTCPSEYFQNGSICSSCQSPCKQCTSPTICTSCVTGKELYQSSCSDNCPTNTVSQSGVCVNCSTNCKTCQASASLCASCYSTNYLLNGVCYQTCPPTYYPNDTTIQCERCVTPCLACSNSTVCSTCTTGYSLDGSLCVENCPTGKLSVSQVCTTCNSQCLTCVGTVSACTTCQSGLLYNQDLSTCTATCQTGYYKLASTSTCILVCPAPYYNSTTQCLSCPTLCTACSSASICSACSTGAYYYSSMCYLACPTIAPYTSADGQSCLTCSVSNCQTCSAELCIACQLGYFNILKTSCISGCSTNQTYNSTSLNCEITVIPNNTTNTTNNTNSTTNTTTNTTTPDTTTSVKLTFVPLPYLIVTLVVLAVIAVGKLQHQKMTFSNSVLPFVSCLCFYTAITNALMAILNTSPISLTVDLYLLIGGVGLTVILNILNQIFVCTDLRRDPAYQEFLPQHYCGVGTVMLLSIISPFKWVQIIHSNCFGFSLFGLVLSQQAYTNKFITLQWVSILASASYIGSGCINALQASYSKYVFYGGIQLVVLSLLEIALTIASNRTDQPLELKYKETMTQQLQEENKVENIDSHNEIYSQNNIKDLSHEALDSNQLNIFDVIGPQALEDAKVQEKRAQTAQTFKQHTERASSARSDQIEYQSALEYNRMDPLKVENKHIEKALEEGVFRHNAKSILQIKRKEEDESALADAVKLYHLEMRRKGEAEQLYNRESRGRQQKVEAPPTQPAKQQASKQLQESKPESNLNDEQPEQEQEVEINMENDHAEQMQMIIFDDGEELKSIPTHVSKQLSNKQKRINSLGSLALIIEEDAQQLEQINLDSDRKQTKPLQKTTKQEQPATGTNNADKLPPKQPANKQTGKKEKGVKKERLQKDTAGVQIVEDRKVTGTEAHAPALDQPPMSPPKKNTQLLPDVLPDVLPDESKPGSILIDEPDQEQHLAANSPNRQLVFDAGEQAGEIINNSPKSSPKKGDTSARHHPENNNARKTPRYDDANEDQEIASPTQSKPKQREAPPIKQPAQQKKEGLPPKYPPKPPSRQNILLIDDSSHGDMIEGYQEVEEDNLDSETGSSKKLVPVTYSLEQQKANLKSKLISNKPRYEQPEIPIIVQHGHSPRRRDDLESIFTAEDIQYEDTRKFDDNPMARRTGGNFPQDRRYIEGDHDQDLVRPSQLFRGARPARRVQNLSVGGQPSLLRPNDNSKLQLLRKNLG